MTGPFLVQNEVVVEGGRHVGALTLLAERTEGYSGSDLHDLCALAAQQPIHRFMAQGDSCAQGFLAGPPAGRIPPCTLQAAVSWDPCAPLACLSFVLRVLDADLSGSVAQGH